MRAKIAASFIDENHRKWWTLAAVSFGLFMIMLDNTVVNVALPSIQADLNLKISELEWVLTGYALTFGAFMLTGGKLADLLGRRRIFVIGLVIFTASSLGCGLAGSAAVLIGARVVQGLGAALMNPATLSIITVSFPPKQRGTAIGIWAGVSALALAIGPLVGGIITERINWSWIFFINVPIGVIAIVAAFVFIDESRDTSSEQRPDIPGLVTSALGLFALTYGLIEANEYGWTSARILGSFAVAAVSLVAFVLLERNQRLPMLELALFRNKGFSGANSVMLLVGLAMFGIFFYVSLYVQQILGFSAIQAGASFLPWTVLIVLLAPQAGRLSDRIGPRPFVAGGMVILSGRDDRLLAHGRGRGLLGTAARNAARRRRDVGRNGTGHRRGDAVRAAGQGGRRLRGAEQHAPGGRLDGDRDHGGDRRRVHDRRAARPDRLPARLPPRAGSRPPA